MQTYLWPELQDRWRELEASGTRLEPMEYRVGSDRRRGLVIEQQGDPISNMIVELENRSTRWILDALVSCDYGATLIQEISVEAPWPEDSLFEWLPDPAEDGRNGARYLFPGKDPLEYPRKGVLNHKISDVLRHGLLRGLLLGVGYRPLPEKYRHGAEVEISLKILDHRGHSYSFPFRLWIDRSETQFREKRTRKTREKIFGDSDDSLDSLCE